MNIHHHTELILYRRRNRAYPPSVLLLRIPNYRHESKKNNREKKRPIPHMIGLRVNDLDLHDNSNSSFGWQRYSDKIGRISPAPDLVYRNTYLDKSKKKNSTLNHSFSCYPSQFSQPKHSIDQYKNINDRIRQIEQQQRNLSSRIQRPQNEDQIFRRIVGEKKSSISKSSSTTQSSLSFFHGDLKSPESFVNYLNYSRLSRSSLLFE